MGIGGWTYEPWRGVFFPEGLARARELEYASRQVSAIEINGTFYRTQTPATFRKWAAEVPDGFVFSLKAPRYAVNRKLLAEAGDSIARFVDSGIGELGDRLGPLLWQFAPTKRFEPEDFAAFLELLPREAGGRPLRHALEVRHNSFLVPAFLEMARARGAAIVFADSEKYPQLADLTSDFAYARLQRSAEDVPTGYTEDALDRWAAVARGWAAGERPEGLNYVAPPTGKAERRDVFVYMINGAKVRAPAAATALLERLRG